MPRAKKPAFKDRPKKPDIEKPVLFINILSDMRNILESKMDAFNCSPGSIALPAEILCHIDRQYRVSGRWRRN